MCCAQCRKPNWEMVTGAAVEAPLRRHKIHTGAQASIIVYIVQDVRIVKKETKNQNIVNATRIPPRPIGGLEALESLSAGLLGGSEAALWRPEALFGSSGAALGRFWGCSGAALGRLWGLIGGLLAPSGPKWPSGWPQEAGKWAQEAP